jgi:hypothetical protein
MAQKVAVAVSIRDVGSMKTRALLRGLLNRHLDTGEARSTLFKLLDGVNRSDMRVVDELIREDRLFQHLAIPAEFPVASPFDGMRDFPMVPHDDVALDYIAFRIGHSEADLCEAFSGLSELNRALATDDDARMANAIEYIILRSGHSLALARKMAFIIGYAPKETLSYRLCLELVETYGINQKNYGVMAMIDSIGSDFNYLDLKYRFRKFATIARGASISPKVSHLCFAPIAFQDDDVRALVSASYDVSLVDAAIALLAHRDLGLLPDTVPISPAIEAAWAELGASLGDQFDYFDAKSGYEDTQAFRAAPAFLEDARFRRLRATFQSLYDIPALRNRSAFIADSFAGRFFEGVDHLDDLVPATAGQRDPLPDVFDTNTAGVLARSCGIIWICERDPDFSQLTAASMALLMGSSFEIDRLLSTDALRKAAGRATDPFVKLLLHTLLRAHSSATRDSYNFKEQFQTYVRQFHDGDILAFMESVRTLSPEIISYFVELLDETMLSQMAFLMASSNSIYETRASLLEWYGDAVNDEAPKENARQLRLDRKIAAVRGAINETRLNIDAVRFRQWIDQNKLSSFSNFIRQKTPNLPSLEELTDKSKYQSMILSEHRVPTTRALLAIIECYEQFCKNADFGIASFLGRRIRHGTLRGTLLTGIPDVSSSDLPHGILSQYQSWTKEFSGSVNSLAARLHFIDRTSHKSGLISAEIDTPQKWQTCVVCLNAIFEQSQKDHGALSIPMQIEQYCWLIFEQELVNVQASISDARNRWGMLKLRHNPNDTEVIAFEKSVNLTLADQFNTVISWFKKPPNVSAIADLSHVIEVVLREACDEYPTFSPDIQFSGEEDIKLSGSNYSFVYDGLTIAVRNAAKHGKCPGRLAVGADVQPQGESKVLRLSVTSDVRADDCPDRALRRMRDAGDVGAQDADIVEGLSGMRKLKKMAVDRRILDFELESQKEPQGKVSVAMRFPFEGVVE